MAFIGYAEIEGGGMTPIAANADHDACFRSAFERLTTLCAGDFWTLQSSSMAVQERDITAEEAEKLDALIAEELSKPLIEHRPKAVAARA